MKAVTRTAAANTLIVDEITLFRFVFIVFSFGRAVISVVLLLLRDRRRLRPCDRRLLHRGSFRRRPCYDRLCCYWLARGFRYHRRQILLRLEKRN